MLSLVPFNEPNDIPVLGPFTSRDHLYEWLRGHAYELLRANPRRELWRFTGRSVQELSERGMASMYIVLPLIQPE